MIYNNGHRFVKNMPAISQADIWNVPEFFACSYEEIVHHPQCTIALKILLDHFPWSGRNNVIQVKPQNWVLGRPDILGDGWHMDVNVRLADGVERSAKSMDDWRLMICSWGGVVGTDFMVDQFHGPDATPPHDYGIFFENMNRAHPYPRFITAQPEELWEYSSRDIHRVSLNANTGRVRLMIVAFECDETPAKGMVFPALANRVRGCDPTLDFRR